MRYWPTKTPDDLWDLGLDWGPSLSALGDPTITDSTWITISGDVVISLDSILPDNRQTGARVGGGTADTETVFRNVVTLSNGQVLSEDVFIKVRA